MFEVIAWIILWIIYSVVQGIVIEYFDDDPNELRLAYWGGPILTGGILIIALAYSIGTIPVRIAQALKKGGW